MAYKVILSEDAQDDFKALDNSIQIQVFKKTTALQENPFLGDPLGKKFDLPLTGFYKLSVANKAYRVVYRFIEEEIEVIEIVAIGKRDRERVYYTMAKRLKSERKKNRVPVPAR